MSADLTILVVEDKTLLAHDIKDRLNQFGHHQILGPFSSGEEAYEQAQSTPPDIAILDIHLAGEMNGIELARLLNEDRPIPTIFLTHNQDSQTLDESLKTGAIAYINKPFTNNELRMALHTAISHLGKIAVTRPTNINSDQELKLLDDRIFVRNGRGKFFILLDDILWIQSNGGDTSSIMTKEKLGQEGKPLPVIGLNLAKLSEKLAFHPYLVRASRYYIINLKNVDRILDTSTKESTTVKKAVLIANNEIILGDQYRKAVTDRFLQF